MRKGVLLRLCSNDLRGEMFDKKKGHLHLGFYGLLKRRTEKGLKKVRKESEKESVCVRETKRQRDDIDDDEEEEEDDLVAFVRAVPENGAHARLLCEKETTKCIGFLEAADDTHTSDFDER